MIPPKVMCRWMIWTNTTRILPSLLLHQGQDLLPMLSAKSNICSRKYGCLLQRYPCASFPLNLSLWLRLLSMRLLLILWIMGAQWSMVGSNDLSPLNLCSIIISLFLWKCSVYFIYIILPFYTNIRRFCSLNWTAKMSYISVQREYLCSMAIIVINYPSLITTVYRNMLRTIWQLVSHIPNQGCLSVTPHC